MSETTSNGHEIKNPVEMLSAADFSERMAEQFGLLKGSPEDRATHLRQMSTEGIAILLEDINKTVQGSGDSLINHEAMTRIGGKDTIDPGHRYEVFSRLVEDVRSAPENINPARLGDVLALGVVLLHPFYDGNGRTARVLGLMFRDGYDTDEFQDDYDIVTEPRDRARERGGFVIYGYIPHLSEGTDQSDPSDVSQYLRELLHAEKPGAYTSCFGQAGLYEKS